MRTTAGGGGGGGGGMIQTDTGTMQTAHDHVLDVYSNIVSTVNSMMSQLDGLDQSAWDGNAKAAFVTAKVRWNDNRVSLQKALDDIANGLDSSKRAYVGADDTNSSNFQKVSSGLA